MRGPSTSACDQAGSPRKAAAAVSSACNVFSIGLSGARDTSTKDRKSTRLNSSHQIISYAVFCLKKKNQLVRKNERLPEIAQDPHMLSYCISLRGYLIQLR